MTMFPNGKVTMTDAQYTAMVEHDAAQAAKLQEQRVRIRELEAELKEAEGLLQGWVDDSFSSNPTRDIAGETAAFLLASAKETPVSTLCAVCDQIKELHPSTHEWTAKETNGDADEG